MNKTPAEHWDTRYSGDEFLFGTEPNDFLKSVSDRIKPAANILCLADGEGRNGVFLASEGHHVTSVDQSLVGLKKAQALAGSSKVNLETIHADLSTFDLGSGEWDCIVSIFFHIPPSLRDLIYPGIIQALAPDGLLILESYRPEQLGRGTGGPPSIENMLAAAEIETRFSTLTTRHLQSIERSVIEGHGHTGDAAVVQYIGQKTS